MAGKVIPKMVAEASATALAAPPERTPEEQSLVETFLARHKNQPPKAKLTDRKLRTLEADARDIPLWFAKMAETLAIQDPDLQSVLLGQAAGIFWKCDAQTALNATLAFLHDVRPLDATEGLLALQMMATHNAAMEMLRRALLEEQPPDIVDKAVIRATKLLRIFSGQVETLQRYRGKGTTEQRVVVEHVNVFRGGRAIVGAISKNQGGTGGEN